MQGNIDRSIYMLDRKKSICSTRLGVVSRRKNKTLFFNALSASGVNKSIVLLVICYCLSMVGTKIVSSA